MQRCSHCGAENIDGIIFCEKCGIALVPTPLITRKLGEGEITRATSELNDENVLILHVDSVESPIMLQLRKELILGRVSEQAENVTYLNLTPYGADDLGVSRRHARLLRDQKAVYLTDLNSTNGTRLNGESLPSSVEKRLRDGDEIALGKLKLYVYFKI